MIDGETQTTVADRGVLVQEAATQADVSSGDFICRTDPAQIVECLSDLMQGDTVSTPFMLGDCSHVQLLEGYMFLLLTYFSVP